MFVIWSRKDGHRENKILVLGVLVHECVVIELKTKATFILTVLNSDWQFANSLQADTSLWHTGL